MALKKVDAVSMENDKIILASIEDIEEFYKTIKDDEDILLSWDENGVKHTKLFICEGILTKLKDGSLELRAEGGKKK